MRRPLGERAGRHGWSDRNHTVRRRGRHGARSFGDSGDVEIGTEWIGFEARRGVVRRRTV